MSKQDASDKRTAAGIDAQSYEEARSRLVEIVARLEQGSIPLEESLQLWEIGEQLARYCQDWLDGARERLAKVRGEADGIVADVEILEDDALQGVAPREATVPNGLDSYNDPAPGDAETTAHPEGGLGQTASLNESRARASRDSNRSAGTNPPNQSAKNSKQSRSTAQGAAQQNGAMQNSAQRNANTEDAASRNSTGQQNDHGDTINLAETIFEEDK